MYLFIGLIAGYYKDSLDHLSFLNSSEFVDLHRTVPRSRWTAGHFRILIFLPRGEEICGEARKKEWIIFLSNLPLLEGNMLYLISILVVEYLDCQYRWEFYEPEFNAICRHKVCAFALHVVRINMGDFRTLLK
jgi:hypothetical protein